VEATGARELIVVGPTIRDNDTNRPEQPVPPIVHNPPAVSQDDYQQFYHPDNQFDVFVTIFSSGFIIKLGSSVC
jgi:hypothetical protein